MYNLKWYQRLVIVGIIFLLSGMASIATKSNMWVVPTIGCAVYSVIDQLIYNLRFKGEKL